MSKNDRQMLETDRLTLRPWQESDAAALYQLARHPEVGPAAGWPPHTSVAHSREVIRTVFAAPEIYAVVLRGTDCLVGCCGLLFGDDINTARRHDGEAEIGYWIGREYWGRGFAPEAVEALTEHCFGALRIPALWISFREGNDKSRRVAEKCGFSYHHTEHNKPAALGGCHTELFYKRHAAQQTPRDNSLSI